MTKPLVLMDHDGGVDDYLSLMLLLTMDTLHPLGVVVTPADCYIQSAVRASRKILDLMGHTHMPVAQSTVRGLNPFPHLYRRDSCIIDHLPILNEVDTLQTALLPESGQEFMAAILLEAPRPVTLLVTGPLTTVAAALDQDPSVAHKIARIVWMGGALGVPGNVERSYEPGQDGTAEWNAYWDPLAAEQVWQTQIPIVLCPLDLTNQVPVTSHFVRQLARQRRFALSDLAGQCYALMIPQQGYFWDVLATAYLARPEIYQVQEVETVIVPHGSSQGRTLLHPGGRRIHVLAWVDIEAFQSYLLEQWASS
ncbi:nucleoside hydrolase [Anthocerotibacter panamensis]|uniref:nucleoside hydrolase n=1 Tax=Anthocerotibacter panamensis TaxID=2857077 RepID=UPI001C4079C3|nr:nucleoside hydrolase [Anthocerotibacter panamensis]